VGCARRSEHWALTSSPRRHAAGFRRDLPAVANATLVDQVGNSRETLVTRLDPAPTRWRLPAQKGFQAGRGTATAHPVSFLLNFDLGEDAGHQPRPIGSWPARTIWSSRCVLCMVYDFRYATTSPKANPYLDGARPLSLESSSRRGPF